MEDNLNERQISSAGSELGPAQPQLVSLLSRGKISAGVCKAFLKVKVRQKMKAAATHPELTGEKMVCGGAVS